MKCAALIAFAMLLLVSTSQARINHAVVRSTSTAGTSASWKLYPGLDITQTFSTPMTVFVHYQVTWGLTGHETTMLVVNGDPVSMAAVSMHEHYRSLIGFWANVVTPGTYRFQVMYKATGNVGGLSDWATNAINVFWMDYPDTNAISSHLSCDEPLSTNNFWRSLDSTTASLIVPEDRVVLALYTASFTFPSTVTGEMFTQLEVDGYPDKRSTCSKGLVTHTNLFGGYAETLNAGLHQFRFRARASHDMQPSFCGTPFGQSLAAVVLPQGCNVDKVCPESAFSLTTNNAWTDIPGMSLQLHTLKTTDIIAMYQYSGYASRSHVVTRLVVNGNPVTNSPTITGNSIYAGNFNLWSGRLGTGHHSFELQLRSPATIVQRPTGACNECGWETRCLTVIHCPV